MPEDFPGPATTARIRSTVGTRSLRRRGAATDSRQNDTSPLNIAAQPEPSRSSQSNGTAVKQAAR